jgi:hypothetical protein
MKALTSVSLIVVINDLLKKSFYTSIDNDGT